MATQESSTPRTVMDLHSPMYALNELLRAIALPVRDINYRRFQSPRTVLECPNLTWTDRQVPGGRAAVGAGMPVLRLQVRGQRSHARVWFCWSQLAPSNSLPEVTTPRAPTRPQEL